MCQFSQQAPTSSEPAETSQSALDLSFLDQSRILVGRDPGADAKLIEELSDHWR
ncbi:hypothetical protein MBRU_16140 [Mycolicibacterium brumae DSM 44177]|nr:hypothetical protein MBRU_16140 [Mycolicibacterium brumae DSM 44177]